MGTIIKETIPDSRGAKGIIVRDLTQCEIGQCVEFNFSEFIYSDERKLKLRVETILVGVRKTVDCKLALRWGKNSFKIYKL